jgi:hypothetical protein
MSVTVEQLQTYVGTKETGTFIDGCLSSANIMVANKIGAKPVPTSVIDQCVLTVASELFHRRSAPNGVAQFADIGGNAVRVSRDPLTSIHHILLPFIGYAV